MSGKWVLRTELYMLYETDQIIYSAG